MAENTIDNLSISVVASAEKAINTFDRLASGASGLKSAANGAAGGMQDMAQGAKDAGTATQQAGTQAGKARPNIKGVGKDAKDAGENAKKGSSGLATFWQSLKRIAYYRMIRSVIKAISEAFKEGAQNLYQWSNATGLSDFKKNMDRIATSALYLKNSLGAMLEPIVRAFTPIIETVVDGLVWIINHVNMLFAMLSGSQTYTVAKKVATTWSDAGKTAASSAKKAADDIKRTILGFDEINKLEKENTNSVSSGSGSNTNGLNYSDMFEERKLTGLMSNFASVIEKFNAGWAGVIAGLLAGWAAIKLAIKGVASLSLGWLKDMAGKSISIAVSLVRSGWKTIKAWAVSFGEAVVDLAVRVKTKIAELWANIAAKWAALHPVLQVGIAITLTAAALWAAYKLAWALAPEKMLQVEVGIKTSAKALWGQLKTSWNTVQNRVLEFSVSMVQTASGLWIGLKCLWNSIQNRVLQFSVSIVQTAKGLWNGLKTSWNKIQNRVLEFSVSVSQTASRLWDGINKGWGTAQEHVVQFSVSIVQTANGLWEGFKKSWNSIQNRVLQFSVSMVQTASGLWNGLKTEWEKVSDKVLTVTSKITTTAQSLWNWLKENWEKVALGALGIAIAIATPWETVAAALGALWGNVTASFGGALAFAVAPELNKTPAQIKEELEGLIKPISIPWQIVSTTNGIIEGLGGAADKLKKSLDLTLPSVDVTVNAVPGVGFVAPGAGTGKANSFTLKNIDAKNVVIDASAGRGFAAITPTGILTLKGIGAMAALVSLAINKGNSNDAAVNALTTGSYDKKVSMSVNVSGADSSFGGDIFVDDSGVTGATSSVTGLINAFEKLKNNLTKKLKIQIGQEGTPPTVVNTALTFKSGLKKAVKVEVAKSGSINGTVGNALDAPAENYKTVNVALGADSKNSSSTAVKAVESIGKKVSISISAVVTSLAGATTAIANFFGIGKKAMGGVFSNGVWSNIPQYAGGTLNAHGSLFLAGEAGPEIVGHVGGRTEVLNKSQLASAMYNSVRNAMSGITLDANIYSGGNGEFDYDIMYRAMYDAFTAALSRNDERDREKLALMREIAAKDFNPEITAASINKAQTRMNRRAGTTIVSVGT
jgi:hypothetical protein